MSIFNNFKIKQLLASWPDGSVRTTSALVSLGYSHGLVVRYKKSGWIELLHKGAYFRPSARFPKPILVGALNGILHDEPHNDIHLGGLSALEVLGNAHFVQSGKRPHVWLFAQASEKLPLWLKKHDWKVELHFHPKNMFSSDEGLTIKDWNGFDVRISSRERAIFEFLSLVSLDHTLDHAGLLMEQLSTLRPLLVQKLLEDCHSVKAKRLLVALADKLGHAWLKKINLKKVDLGSGPISLQKGASLHPKYQISLPRSLQEGEMKVGA